MDITDLIRELMLRSHESITGLADKAGLHRNTLHRLLAGTRSPRVSQLEALAQATDKELRIEFIDRPE